MTTANRRTDLQQRLEVWQRVQDGQTDPVIAHALSVAHDRAQMAAQSAASGAAWSSVYHGAASVGRPQLHTCCARCCPLPAQGASRLGPTDATL